VNVLFHPIVFFLFRRGFNIIVAVRTHELRKTGSCMRSHVSSVVLPSRFFVYFEAIWGRHSVVPQQNRSLRLGMAGQGSVDTIIRLGLHVQRLRQRESSSHGQVSGLCSTVMMQFRKFRRGLAPGALRRDHCQHGMVRTVADRPRRPRLIWTLGLLRIAGNLTTQIDSYFAGTGWQGPGTLTGPERAARVVKARSLRSGPKTVVKSTSAFACFGTNRVSANRPGALSRLLFSRKAAKIICSPR